MTKIILTKDQIYELTTANRYKVNEEMKLLSRCIDGRYDTKEGLAPLATLGADIGELSLLAATANTYGFNVELDKAFDVLVELVGGIKNVAFHSDFIHEQHELVGCGYIAELKKDPALYHIEPEQIDFITQKIEEVTQKGAFEILHGAHHEAAMIQIQGNYSIYPRYSLTIGAKEVTVEVFLYHKSLADQRRRIWSKKLIEESAVVLYDNLDQEYLYEVLTNTSEEHLFETAKKLGEGLPLYGVNFDADGGFKVEELGIL